MIHFGKWSFKNYADFKYSSTGLTTNSCSLNDFGWLEVKFLLLQKSDKTRYTPDYCHASYYWIKVKYIILIKTQFLIYKILGMKHMLIMKWISNISLCIQSHGDIQVKFAQIFAAS